MGDAPPIAQAPPERPSVIAVRNMTPAHRSWRTKVFIATWLSYVGYYFCRKPFTVVKAALGEQLHWSATTLANIYATYLITYALGQFLASYMGTKLGMRKNLLLGMSVSVVVTIVMTIWTDPWIAAGLMAVLGVAQATGWSGNVGTMANWFHKHERGRVMGVWSTNFTIGSLVSTAVLALVLGLHGKDEPEPWRWCFYAGALTLFVVIVQFVFLQRNKPEDAGLVPIDDPVTAVDESTTGEDTDVAADKPWLGGLSRRAWVNLLLVGGFYFCAKFVRYAVWSWAPYFLKMNYGITGPAANMRATLFELAGLPGVYLTGWLSDKFFQSRRSEVAMMMMIALTIGTGLLVFLGQSVSAGTFTVMLGAVGFTLYGPDALLSGAGAMDIGGRHRAAFATAVISGFGSTGAVVQEVVIGRLYDSKNGDLGPVFVMLLGSAIVGMLFCLALVLRNRKGGKGI